jgi:ribose transport system permease protein
MTQLGTENSGGAVVAEHAPAPASGQSVRRIRAVLTRPSTGMLVVLILLFAVFSALAPNAFLGTYNFRNIGLSAAVIGVMAIGQTFVLATGGIDLSVGSVLVFSTVTSAQLMLAMGGTSAGWAAVAAGVAISIASGAFWGLVSGLAVTYLRVPPLITTLGTLGMALGAAQILTSGLDIHAVPSVMVNQIGYQNLAGLPVLVVIAIVVALVAGFVMWQTSYGVRTKAIGSNREGALRSGIAVRRHLISIYMVSGSLAGLAGAMSLAQFSTTTIGGHTSDNLTTIAGVVLGGTSLFGGVATIFGTVVGILVPITLQSGFVILDVPAFWQTFVIGAVLIIAVFVDQVRRSNQNRR